MSLRVFYVLCVYFERWPGSRQDALPDGTDGLSLALSPLNPFLVMFVCSGETRLCGDEPGFGLQVKPISGWAWF